MLLSLEKASMSRLYIEIIAAIALAGAGTGIMLWYNHHERQIGAEQCLAKQKEQAYKDAKQGQDAVKNALANAERAAAEDASKRKHDADEQLKNASKVAESLHAKNLDLQRRYEKALIQDKSCAAWSQQPVACPLE